MKKKIISLMLVFGMVFGLAACGAAPQTETVPTAPAAEAQPAAETPAPAETAPAPQPEEEGDALNEYQKALVATAQAMLARGEYVQYDDSRLIQEAPAGVVTYRWQKAAKTPEDYTKQRLGYTNCAAFTYDCYYLALGMDIVYWSTSQLIQASKDELVLYQEISGSESEAERASFEEKFMDELQVGDIIVYRKKGNTNGHAMLYAGEINGEKTIIHSTSSSSGSYKYADKAEDYDKSGSVRTMMLSELFNPESKRYIYNICEKIGLVRPLNIFDGEIPEATKNRMENLQDIVVQKLCSRSFGQTASVGEELVYTYEIRNTGSADAELTVTDSVPAGTSFVSGCDSVSGDALSWNVKVAAGSKEIIEYTVRIEEGTDVVLSEDGTVGGVPVSVQPIYVRNTYDADTLAGIEAAAAANKDSKLSGWDLAEKVYADAGLSLSLDDETVIMDDLYTQNTSAPGYYLLNEESSYLGLVIPEMYGGYHVCLGDAWGGDRTRGPRLTQLLPGDIVLCQDLGDNEEIASYMIAASNKVLGLSGSKAGKLLSFEPSESAVYSTLGYTRFAILRPSMVE